MLNKFFPIVDTCLSCKDIARQSCAMVPRWRFLAPFLRPAFPVSRVQQVSDLHLKFALRPDLQSAYRAHHSTETAVLKVLSDILTADDNGDLAMLALLDLSAAFDSVDQKILLRRLEISYGLGGVVLQWFVSYLDHRTQFVRCRNDTLTPLIVEFGVPPGVRPWTHSVPPIHSRHTDVDPVLQPATAFVCRRYPDIWVLSARRYQIS